MRLVVRCLAILPLVLALGVLVAPVHAATTYNVTGQFIQDPSMQGGCGGDVCGTGWMMPFGQATDSLVYSTGVKTFSFASGTLSVVETFVGGYCSNPFNNDTGSCGLFTGQSSSVVVGGTGAFAGATGLLLDTFTLACDHVTAAGYCVSDIARYTGTITLAG